MNFTIKRSEWLRGEGPGPSYLLREIDGKRCCVGQMLQQLGVPDNALSKKGDIVGLKVALELARLDHDPETMNLPLWKDIEAKVLLLVGGEQEQLANLTMFSKTEGWISEAYEENDAECVSDDLRESQLTKLFANNGHDVVFV